jgi:hypothetical protein
MLVLCMLMIGASTLLVAFLPTYDQVGLWHRRCWWSCG